MAAMTPLKGSPSAIESQAAALTAAAENMSEADTQLGNVSRFSGYNSAAVKQVADDAKDVRGAVQKAEIRYRGAGKHLDAWASALEEVQKDAKLAISDWKSVDVDGPAAAVSQARDERNGHFPLTDKWSEADENLRAKKELLRNAQDDRSRAEERYRAAQDRRDQLAQKYAALIEKNNKISGLNDSLIDKIKDAVAKVPWDKILDVLKKIADIVSVVATILGVLLIWTPLGGPLLLVGRVAAAVSAVVSLVQLLRGKISLGEFLFAVVLAAGFGLTKVLKLGKFGKAISKLAGGNRLAKTTKNVVKSVKGVPKEAKIQKYVRSRSAVTRNLKANAITPERAERLRGVADRNFTREVFDLPVKKMGESSGDFAGRVIGERLKEAATDYVVTGVNDAAEYGINYAADQVLGGHEFDIGTMSAVSAEDSNLQRPDLPDFSINVMPGADGVIPSIDISIPTEITGSFLLPEIEIGNTLGNAEVHLVHSKDSGLSVESSAKLNPQIADVKWESSKTTVGSK